MMFSACQIIFFLNLLDKRSCCLFALFLQKGILVYDLYKVIDYPVVVDPCKGQHDGMARFQRHGMETSHLEVSAPCIEHGYTASVLYQSGDIVHV